MVAAMLERFREYPADARGVLGARYCTLCVAGGEVLLLEGDERFTPALVAARLADRGLPVLSVRAGDGVMDWHAEVTAEKASGSAASRLRLYCPYGHPEQTLSLVIMGWSKGQERPLIGISADRRRWGANWLHRDHGPLAHRLALTSEQAARRARLLGTVLPEPQEFAALLRAEEDRRASLRCKEYRPARQAVLGMRYWATCVLQHDGSPVGYALVQAREPVRDRDVEEQLRALGAVPRTIDWSGHGWRAALTSPLRPDGVRYYLQRGAGLREDEVRTMLARVDDQLLYFQTGHQRWARWSGLMPGSGPPPGQPWEKFDSQGDESELLLIGRDQAGRLARAERIPLPDERWLAALAATYRPAAAADDGPGGAVRPALVRSRPLAAPLRAPGARFCTTVRVAVPQRASRGNYHDFPALLLGDEPFTPASVAAALSRLGLPVSGVTACEWPPGEWWVELAAPPPRCWDDGFRVVCEPGGYDRVLYLERRLTDPDVSVGCLPGARGWETLAWTAGQSREWWGHGRNWGFPLTGNPELRLLVTRAQAADLARALGAPLPAEDEWTGLTRAAGAVLDGLHCHEYPPTWRRLYGARYWSRCTLQRDGAPALQAFILAEQPLTASAVAGELRQSGIEATGLAWHADGRSRGAPAASAWSGEWRGRLLMAPLPGALGYRTGYVHPAGGTGDVILVRGTATLWYSADLARWQRSEREEPERGVVISRGAAEQLVRRHGRELPAEDEFRELAATYRPAHG
jgi:hypothetical protein